MMAAVDISKFFKRKNDGQGPAPKKTRVETTASKKKAAYNKTYEKQRPTRKFLESWKADFPWVEQDLEKDIMYCKLCRKYPSIAETKSSLFKGTGPGVGGQYKRETLEPHHTSSKHLLCETRIQNEKAPQEAPMQRIITKLTRENEARMNVLFDAAYYTADRRHAFKEFPYTCDLLEKEGVDVGNNYRNDRACKEFVKSIAQVEHNSLEEELNGARFLCVLADGSTDCAFIEQESVYVRFVDSGGKAQTKLACMMAIDSGNADGVLKAILEALNSVGLDKDTIKAKLIGCNFDGAAVMMGKDNGVSKKLKDMVDHEFVAIHCVAHNLELGALDASKGSPYLTKFNDYMIHIFKFYHYSPKKRRELHEMCALLEQDEAFYSGLQSTRWLASQHRALLAVEKNLASTFAHIEHVASNGSTKEAAKAKGILKEIKNVKFVRQLYFMIDVQDILSVLSRQFQSDDASLTDVVSKLDIALLKLEDLKHNNGKYYQKFLDNYNTDTSIFMCGKLCDQPVELPRDPHSATADTCLHTWLDTLIGYVNARFSKLQQSPVKEFLVFDHTTLPLDRSEIMRYGNKEIKYLVETYSPLLSVEEQDAALDQWLDLKLRMSRNRHIPSMDLLSGLLQANHKDLQHILVLIKIMFTLSPSTAKLERSFSAMKSHKTNLKTHMGQDTLQMLMRVNDSEQTIKSFSATAAIENWLVSTKGNGKRRVLCNVRPKTSAPSIVNAIYDGNCDSVDLVEKMTQETEKVVEMTKF